MFKYLLPPPCESMSGAVACALPVLLAHSVPRSRVHYQPDLRCPLLVLTTPHISPEHITCNLSPNNLLK